MSVNRRAPRETRPRDYGPGAVWEVFHDGRPPQLARGAPVAESACGDMLVPMVTFAAALAWLRITRWGRL